MRVEPFFRLKNQIQPYDWGTKEAFTELFGWENTSGEPRAELWMGSHIKAPSLIIDSGKEYGLDSWITDASEGLLGPKLYERKRLSFLFKVLSASKALSIQVHPNKEQAKNGFVIEQRLGIPLDAHNRNYKDDNHKPELICALTPFVAMCGFRPVDQVLALLESLSLAFLEDSIDDLRTASLHGEQVFYEKLKDFYLGLMRKNPDETAIIAKTCEDIIGNKPSENDFDAYKNQTVLSPYLECLLMQQSYPDDLAILSPFFMNLYHLAPGKALFLSAGIPHAYLRGTGLEIMASSDNVLRGGLTPKYIDVQELEKVMIAGPHDITLTAPVIKNENFYYYQVPVNDFSLLVIHQENDLADSFFTVEELAIILCISGTLTIINDDKSGVLVAGESAVISPGDYTIRGEGKLAVASEG